jgi:hypothetical protein
MLNRRVGSCGLSPGRGVSPSRHRDGDQPGVTVRTEITGEVGKHAVEQFVGVGWFEFGVVGWLSVL